MVVLVRALLNLCSFYYLVFRVSAKKFGKVC